MSDRVVYAILLGINILLIVIGVIIVKKGKTKLAHEVVVPIIFGLFCSLLIFTMGAMLGNPITVIKKVANVVYTRVAGEQGSIPLFTKRTSEEFNYKIDCPADFTSEAGEDQETEDDFNLTSFDRCATLNFTARYITGDLPDKYKIEQFRKIYGGTELICEDQLEGDGWYAIATKTSDGMYHYRKCIFTDGIVRMYTFSFPTEQDEKYLDEYDYVSHIENSFRKLHK